MKPRSLIIVALALTLALSFATGANAQPRAFAARQIILDDGLGDMITLQTPAGPFASYSYTFPSTAPAGPTAATPAGTLLGQTLYWDGTNWAASSLLFNNGTKVGIGTATPFYDFERRSSSTTTSQQVGSLFDMTYAPTSATSNRNYGLIAQARFTGAFAAPPIGFLGLASQEASSSVGLNRVVGAGGSAVNSSTQTMVEGIGLHGEAVNNAAGAMTTATGIESYVFNTSIGAITNGRALYLPPPQASLGSITNYYGIYQDNVNAANRWPYWYSDGAGGALVQITGAGRVGIGMGTSAPAYPLDVMNKSTSTGGYSISSNFGAVAQPSAASFGRYVAISAVAESDNANAIGGSGYVEGIRSESQLNLTATAGLGSGIGAAGLASNYGAQTLTNGVGLHGEVRNFDVGTITTASALETAIFNLSTGTITDAKIINVQNPNVSGGGSISNAYGLYVDNITTAAVKNYQIYASNGSGDAHFAVRNDGQVGIGTDAPVATLDIRGSARVGSNANVGAVTGIYNYSGSYDFPSTPAQSSSDVTFSMVGSDIVEGDAVIVRPMSAVLLPNSCYTAWCSGAGQVTLRFNNYSSAAQDPAVGVFKFTLIQH
jgi:hypothetical protein